jgi:hypothetical protein
MSARWRASTRTAAQPRLRALALIGCLPLLATLLLHAAMAADPPGGARLLDAAQARREGVALDLLPHLERRSAILEVRPVEAAQGTPRVVDVAADAGSAAVTPGIGREVRMLTVAHADGSQLQVPIEGLLDAAFATDDSWLAVVDGAGRLWRLNVDDGALRAIADGPFLQAPVVEPDGSILALAVPSVEAPFRSRLVRVSPDGSVVHVSDEALVYDAQQLADGSLAIVAHRPGGTVVRRLAGTSEATVIDLGPDAVNVSVSADGDTVAYQSGAEAFVRIGGQQARSLGRGSNPIVAPDGSAILLSREGGRVLVSASGAELGSLPAAIALLDCGQECGS